MEPSALPALPSPYYNLSSERRGRRPDVTLEEGSMPDQRLGVNITARDPLAALAAIEQAEALGIPAVWLTSGGHGMEPLTLFAAAAMRTQSVKFGTSVVQTYPRHPLIMAQQAQVLDALAPGRFRLGIGPSHGPLMAAMGFAYKAPLGHLRDYLAILNAVLKQGQVDYHGQYYSATSHTSKPVDVPVMISALQRGSFALAGELADGAISWQCPPNYLRDVALPAMREGAQKASRAVPPLICHAPVVVHTNRDEVRKAFGGNRAQPRLPNYQKMLIASGFPEARQPGWSDAMFDALVISGDEERVALRLKELWAMGMTEILAAPVAVGPDPAKSIERTLRLLATVKP